MNKILLYLFFLIFLFSCRKKTDEQFPTLQFFSPGVGTYHHVLDPILFKVKATDETKLETITVKLLNEQLTPVTSSVTLSCSDNDETFESYIITTDIHLSSGLYYLKAEAFDGTNTKVQYREINLIEVPRVLKNLFVVSQPNASLIQIDSVSNGQAFLAHSYSTDFSFSLINSYYSHFGMAGSQTGNYVSFDAEYYNTIFTINNPQSSLNYFISGYVHGDRTFIADDDGKVKSYRKTASAFDIIDFGNQLVKTMLVHDDYIYAYAQNKSTGQKSIVTRYVASGILSQSLNINTSIQHIYYLNSNELLLIGNENNIGKILIYDIALNSVFEPVVFSGGQIYSSCELNDGKVVIAHDNGLTSLNLSTYALGSLSSGNTYQNMVYDDLSNQLFLVRNNIVEIYSYSPFTLLSNTTIADSIIGLHLLYNK